ncbi:MAG: NYN domain-containing protein [Deltaproteobacteria bacterium]|nr:NYN domain-containing protein [Deltaproteobacteria bacterium]
MSLRLAIDGYNLIGVSTDFHDIEALREALIESLAVYRKLRRVKVTVVFDATFTSRLTGSREVRSGIEVVFTRGGERADSIIKEYARVKGAGLTIVTSDREVATYAADRGSVVIGSGEFRGLLESALYEDLKGAALDDEDDAGGRGKKGPSKKPTKAERKKINRLKKL